MIDLDTLRRYVGAVSTQDDALLSDRLVAAEAWIDARVHADYAASPERDEAVLLLASRLYKRRQSPEGTSGFGGEGAVIRIIATDPDIRQQLERITDLSSADTGLGIG